MYTIDILIDYAKNRYGKLRDASNVAISVRDIVKGIDRGARVIHFGSTIRGDWNADSDIDVLIILKDASAKDAIILKVFHELDAPVELHFCTEEEFNNWYLKFIDVFTEL